MSETNISGIGGQKDSVGDNLGLNRGLIPHLYHFQSLIIAVEKIGQFSYEVQIIRLGVSICRIRFCEIQVCLNTSQQSLFHALFQ